jgi:PKD repeat protein
MPFELPAGSSTITMLATWTGGTSTTLRLSSYLKGTFGGSLVNYTPSITGVSPLTLTVPVTGDTSRVFTPQLRSNGSMSNFVVKCQVSDYPATPDGFNRLRGVAPGCQWAAAKALRANNTGLSTWINAAIDDLIFYRTEKNIKVINFSVYLFGDPGINTSMRQKVNTAVNNGILFVGIAGNDGRNATAAQREIDDPNRAALALTLGAANDNNQLTDFTSVGFASPDSTPGQEEDYKPDLMAPGGSAYYSFMMAADSSYGDGPFPDQAANDYSGGRGTSDAAPFASGVAALVIQAMQQRGIQWDFNSSQHPRFVKMVLCATASESNLNRENNSLSLSPTLQRASTGPNGFPVGKDPYEGFGNINADAAVEAVTMTYIPATILTATSGLAPTDQRVWSRTVNLLGDRNFHATLAVTNGDFDLYLYSATPSAYGTPVILASSAQAGTNVAETIDFAPSSGQTALLVVKRIGGLGNNAASFSLQGDFMPLADFITDVTDGVAPLTVNFTNLTTGNATSYSWDFGDGNTSTSVDAAHVYTNAGSYSVTLTVIGPGGTNSLTMPALIVVTNGPLPIVDFVADPTSGLLPLTVFFTNLTTGATNYLWAFGDGQFSTDENPSNTYTNAGNFTVTLTATGLGGATNFSRLKYILVTNLPPVAAFDASPLTGFAPLTVYFTNLSSAATDYVWDFGNGNTSASANPVNIYTSAGTYTVTLAAMNSGGTNTLVRTAYILVNSMPLILSPNVNGDDFTFTFETIAGKTYAIEFKDSLDDMTWQTLQSVPGDGNAITITNSIISVSQRFFRLNVQ